MTLFSQQASRTDSDDRFEVVACNALGLLLIGGVCLIVMTFAWPSERDRSFRQAIVAFDQKSPDAFERIEQHAARYPDDPAGIFLAGEAAAKYFHHERAIEYYRALPRDQSRWELHAELGLARRYRVLGKMLEEEQHLNNVLKLDPTNIDANHRLGHLLQVQGRTWESATPFMMQIRRGKCRGDELLGVSATERFFRVDEDIEYSVTRPEHPQAIASLGTARRMVFENRNEEAEKLLRRIVSESPHVGEAQGRLGRIVFDRGNKEEFHAWQEQLSQKAQQHPEVWFVQGLEARRSGLIEGAIHCFVQAVRLSPNHLPATLQVAGCLELVGEAKAAQEFKRRAEQLSELDVLLNAIRSNVNESLILDVTRRLVALNRYWEAAGWLHVLAHLELPKDPERPKSQQWAGLAAKTPDQNAGFETVLKSLELDHFLKPHWSGESLNTLSRHNEPDSSKFTKVDFQLNDEAGLRGIQFTYFEGTTEATRLQHIFNVVGGGVGVVDFDLDGWPDLHLAQANDWRNPLPQPSYYDRLFRNLRGEQFADVSLLANVFEPGFSHGVGVEDFDQDGFPDLYVCNLGANRLFHNNGDGSFVDVTQEAGIAGNEWSIGSVIADFSGDGLPDVYVGNYSKIEETEKKECFHSTGEPMACTPNVLSAESDRLYLNLGNGGFEEITDASGIRETSGRALGMIAWDFTGNGRLSLFVANDTSANFLFHNLTTEMSGIPLFQEEGILRGLAFDADGNAQGSMGVAAGDAHNDGRIDLFVTNFANESNTFYSQGIDGSFYDVTRQINLRDSGYAMLGFGTQFVDIDSDGWEDLVATNGHVDQSVTSPDADRMRPQLFRNESGSRFSEVIENSSSGYFSKSYLGRAVAIFDFNRDGRKDFAVSHLHAPMALVANRTLSESRPLVIRLIGRHQTRSAIGAKLRLRIGEMVWTRMLVAGDGYLVTNEHSIIFPVPPGETVAELEVVWPGGLIQKWKNPVHGQEILVIEGRDQWYVVGDLEKLSITPPVQMPPVQ